MSLGSSHALQSLQSLRRVMAHGAGRGHGPARTELPGWVPIVRRSWSHRVRRSWSAAERLSAGRPCSASQVRSMEVRSGPSTPGTPYPRIGAGAACLDGPATCVVGEHAVRAAARAATTGTGQRLRAVLLRSTLAVAEGSVGDVEAGAAFAGAWISARNAKATAPLRHSFKPRVNAALRKPFVPTFMTKHVWRPQRGDLGHRVRVRALPLTEPSRCCADPG